MKIASIDFPDPIRSAQRDCRLVVFAGAGVSMGKPACLPSFATLTNKIAEGTGQDLQDREPEDRFLGKLQQQEVDVHERAADILCRENLPHTALHENLLRLYPKVEDVGVVTTNFDLLFERAAKIVFDSEPEVFRAPALPLGRDFHGIVHIHGAVSDHRRMVLTDADFGRAYLTEGWARRFLVDLFNHFVVLFVGYSHEDAILNYLARTLPVEQTNQRFALTPAGDNPQRWEVLGIKPVFYPKSSADEHRALHEGIRKLADFFRLGVLDWQREIAELAQRGPSLDEEEIGRIHETLVDAKKVHFFTDAASSPKWIDWLDKEQHLDGLFGTRDLSEIDHRLAWWLATMFSASNADELFLLIGRHGNRLNPTFWFKLVRKTALGSQDDPPLTKETFARWVSLLLSTAPATIDEASHTALSWMGEGCIQHSLMDSLLDVFDSMAAIRLRISPRISWFDDGTDDQQRPINVELPLAFDHFLLNKLWTEGLRPKLDQLAGSLLERVVHHLEKLHLTFSAWQQANSRFDPTSWDRSGIEPHGQDKHPEAVDVLIDSARDCLCWFAQNQEIGAAYWSDRLAASEAPILRRLSVYTVLARDELLADDKIKWLLTDSRLHDPPAHHEVFQLAKQAFPDASPERRKAFIDAVRAYRWPNEEEPERERLAAYYHLDWLHWLHSVARDCAQTKQAFDNLHATYPKWSPRDHPDLTHWTEGGGIVQPQSPWSTEDLLEKPAADWLPQLLSFQAPEVIGPDRPGLMLAITDAAKRNFTWGTELATSLADCNKWDVDLWDALIRAWTGMKLDEAGHRNILSRLQATELYPEHHRAIATMLRGLMTNGDSPDVYNLLPVANKIATVLWGVLDRDDPEADFGLGWLNRAINHPAGVLAEYWIQALALTRKKHKPAPKVLDDEFRRAFSTVGDDDTLAGCLGRSVLAHQFAFMLTADEQWTQEKLLPFFSAPDDDSFRAVWDGFLTGGQLTPRVAELLDEAFRQAAERILSGPDSDHRHNHFIDYYTTMFCHFAEDPIGMWIPTLLNNSNEAIRKQFASGVRFRLRNLNDGQQTEWWERWLKRYWENRLQAVPVALEPSEIEVMLEWLPHLTAVFCEAVHLAIQMPLVSLTRGAIIRELEEGNLARIMQEP